MIRFRKCCELLNRRRLLALIGVTVIGGGFGGWVGDSQLSDEYVVINGWILTRADVAGREAHR